MVRVLDRRTGGRQPGQVGLQVERRIGAGAELPVDVAAVEPQVGQRSAAAFRRPSLRTAGQRPATCAEPIRLPPSGRASAAPASVFPTVVAALAWLLRAAGAGVAARPN